MAVLEDYNLRTALLIAGPPSGSGRAAMTRGAPDLSGLHLLVRLSAAELTMPLRRVQIGGGFPTPAIPPGREPVRLGERAVWTDPPGV